MDKEVMLEYSQKYKKHQIRLAKIIMIFFITLGVVFICGGLFIAIYKYDKYLILIGLIMVLAGVFNIPLGVKFKNSNVRRITKMSDEEAAKRYCKIYGIQAK